MASGRILVVEDDCAVAGIIYDLLAVNGLVCKCVSTDREAYAEIPTLPSIQALVVDVNLGAGTSGFDVARFARQVIPDVPVIYISGEVSPQQFKAFGVPDSEFVVKPFTADEIVRPLLSRLPEDEEESAI